MRRAPASCRTETTGATAPLGRCMTRRRCRSSRARGRPTGSARSRAPGPAFAPGRPCFALGLPLVQVFVLNPRRGDFRRFGQHLGGQEIDFDDVRPQAVDASLLSIQVRFLVELRVPLANKLIHSVWLASRARRGKEALDDGTPGGLDLAPLALAGTRGRYFVPVQAFHTLRMQSNAFLRWAAP